MKPECLSEQLLFNTVRLTASNGSCGTGSYFNFQANGKTFPTIITNKHVINNNPDEEMTFFVHLVEEGGSTEESYRVTYKAQWIFHPTHDLAFCFAAPVFNAVKQITGKDVFYIGNDMSIIATEEKLRDVRAVEELTMVGYPVGLWDEVNNLPIFRHGYTASHPAYDFNSPGIGLVDMACFPGSSGSPVYILNEGSFQDKHGNMNIGISRLIFLGILYAGPEYTAAGKLQMRDVPTKMMVESQTNIMTNLGYYIRAHELNAFQEIIDGID